MRAIKTTSLHSRDQRYSPLPGIPDDRDRHSLHYTIDTYPDTSTMSKLDVDNTVDAAAKKWKYSGCKINKTESLLGCDQGMQVNSFNILVSLTYMCL